MTTLDFTDREPPLSRKRGAQAEFMAGNSAFYERLQGQGKKSAIERFGWVALPVAAVAILGVVAATSTPHRSANDVGGPPVQTAASTPAPAVTGNLTSAPSNEAASTSPAMHASAPAPAAAKPAPVKVARRAAPAAISSDTVRRFAASTASRSRSTSSGSRTGAAEEPDLAGVRLAEGRHRLEVLGGRAAHEPEHAVAGFLDLLPEALFEFGLAVGVHDEAPLQPG